MNRTTSTIGLCVLVAFTAMISSGCTSKITDEQLAKLRDLRQQEQTLNQQLRAKEDERTRVQNEIKARKAELDKCNSNMQFVKDKLAQWPNVWPK